jgi:glutathione S-transferase
MSELVVHHLNNSRSQRVLFLLEELGLDYRVERYQRDPQTMLAPPALKAIHPLGKSPVLTDGEHVLAESGAILEYIIQRHGNGRLSPAAGSEAELRYRFFMHYAEGSVMPSLLLKLVFDRIESSPMPFFVRPIARMISQKTKNAFIMPQIEGNLSFIEAELQERDWLVGNEFTAADVQMSYPLEAAVARGGLDARYPRTQAYLQRLHARPAYQRALTNGGPYELGQA